MINKFSLSFFSFSSFIISHTHTHRLMYARIPSFFLSFIQPFTPVNLKYIRLILNTFVCLFHTALSDISFSMALLLSFYCHIHSDDSLTIRNQNSTSQITRQMFTWNCFVFCNFFLANRSTLSPCLWF